VFTGLTGTNVYDVRSCHMLQNLESGKPRFLFYFIFVCYLEVINLAVENFSNTCKS
jgi:hypothetical protein